MTPDLKDLAKAGVRARLAELKEEQAALLTMFPHLRDGQTRKAGTAAPSATSPSAEARARKTRKRKPMSAAQKKAVGERMKAYWANRRAEKAGAGDGTQAAAASNGSSRKSGRKVRRKQVRKK